jgi:HK97 family phage major capsid protein
MATITLKALAEQRAALLAEMEAISETAKAETRAYTEEELSRAEELEAQIRAIDATYKAEEARAVLAASPKAVPVDGEFTPTDKTEAEERAFAQYIVDAKAEFRAGENLTMSANGAVIPTSIVNKIISKVKEISPLYAMATKYNIGGTITIPYYDESTSAITMGYVEEFTELESHVGKFKSIELKGYLAGTLSVLSLSLINNSQFDVLGYIVNKMAEAIANWIEKELLHGTSDKITGLSTISDDMTVTAASQTAITADEIMELQDKVIDAFQNGACFIMNRETRSAIRKLKDSDGNYLLNRDISAKWGYTLFGKDVYTTDNADTMAAGKTVIYYGDFSGLAVKLSEDASINVIREKYVTQHAIGVYAYMELDSKIENAQKIACLKMAG